MIGVYQYCVRFFLFTLKAMELLFNVKLNFFFIKYREKMQLVKSWSNLVAKSIT